MLCGLSCYNAFQLQVSFFHMARIIFDLHTAHGSYTFLESRTRTYDGQVGVGGHARQSGGEGRAGQNGTPTDWFA